ncbi:MAG: HAD-IA family hydrolase [Rhodospirillales bacterium]
MSKPLRLAVFDCDGTMVDSQHSIVAAMHAAFAAEGLAPPAAEAVRRVVGLPLLEAIALLNPTLGPSVHETLREQYRQAYAGSRMRGEIDDPMFPGLTQTLDDLERDGWLLGIATGKSHVGLVNTLQTHGLLERFLTLQTADRAAGKPNPDMLLQAMAETGVDKTQTVMIGDTTFDIEMARNAGTLAIGVAWGYHEAEELISAGAHAVVETYSDVVRTVGGLLETV